MRLLIQNGYILTLDSKNRIFERGDIYIDGPKIVEVGCDLDYLTLNPDKVIDATNKLVTPGLVNADLHSAEFLSKGLFENQPLELRLQDSVEGGGFGRMTKELVFETAMLAGIQALKSGVTTIQDHWRFSQMFASEGAAAVMDAYRLLGIRANLALEIDTSQSPRSSQYIEESFPVNFYPSDKKETKVSRVGRIINTLKESIENGLIGENDRLKIAISSPEQLMMNTQFIKWLAELAQRGNTAIHFHFNQTKCQVVNARKTFQGRTAIERAGEMGLLSPKISISHAVWVTPAEIELLAISGVSFIHTPLSDLYAGSGVVPLHLLLEAGVHIGLGSGESCGGNLTLLDVMKMTAEIHRIVQPDYHRWVSVEQVLRMATHGGARACLLEGQVGQIATGSKADLVIYDLKGYSFSPLNNPKDQLVCLEDGSSVDTVLVDGKVVVQDGHVVEVNELEALKQFRTQYQRNGETKDKGGRQKEQMKSQPDDAYQKCIAEPMQIRRWANTPLIDSKLKQAFKKKDI